ncbi:protein FAM98A-like protein [Dinothrombium tinctorium]|uniref:Protein FAM98A-like protein n=1 Tax=Dinothrombium tinctorium TaxID=1965070 RepID=A0A443R100_9ACAR|nr:protein FAM98A-like protein [Dinothrombium tinctorium]
MSLDCDVIDSLTLLKCPFFNEQQFDGDRIENVHFSKIVAWLSLELKKGFKLEHTVHAIESDADLNLFQIELNALIRELNPPFSFNDLPENERKLRILHFLCGEVFAARMTGNKSMRIELAESETAKDLKSLVISLNLGKPPDSVTIQQLFSKVIEKLNQLITSKQLVVEEPLLLKKGFNLNENEWNSLKTLEKLLIDDYTLRREMLITRCDCTVRSFKWKSEDKELHKRIDEVFTPVINKMCATSPITLAHALAARQSDCDILLNSVVSDTHQPCYINAPTKGQANIGKQQRLSLHQYVIGYVPDRGGRPQEQQAPKQETFEEQQRVREQQSQREQNRGGGSGGGQRGGRGGGANVQKPNVNRVQGAGWNQGADNYGGDQRGRQYEQRGNTGGYYQQSNYQDHRDARQYGHNQQDWSQQGYQQPFYQQGYQQGYYRDYQQGYQQEYDGQRYNPNYPQQQRNFRRGGGHRGRY